MIDTKIGQDLKQKSDELRREVRERSIGYIVAALGLVASLAWNDAIKGLIEYFFPLSSNSVWAKFIYAAVLTVIVVVVSMHVIRFIQGDKKNGKG